jgi:hypothetical protein
LSLPWFRMYAEFATDTKVQSMSEALQRRLVMLFCLQCSGDLEKLDDDELACALRIAPDELVKTVDVFERKGFLDPSGTISNWNKRQFKSDSSTERVRAHRASLQQQQGNGDETFPVTPPFSPSHTLPLIPQTDQQTTDAYKNPTAAAPPKQPRVSRVTVPDEWMLDFKLAYPDRAGGHEWARAQRAANSRIREGHTPDQFISGATRYAAYCIACESVGTQYVKTAAAFLGPDKHFLEPWTPPLSKSARRQGRNISASEQWLLDQEAKDAAH